MFNQYPYLNEQDLNLDYILRRMKNLEETVAQFVALESVTFADPIKWSIASQYAKSTIVLDNSGNAYLSKQAVPAGVQLSNADYWLEIFNFTAYIKAFDSNLTYNIEANTNRASKAYIVGDWLLLDDILYKVIVAISADELFVIDTNIERFTVEEFIKAWIQYANGLIVQYKNDIDASELAYRNLLAQDIADTTASLQAQLDAAIAGATVDSEVVNARIGWDSTTYSTLGDAIRAQVTIATDGFWSNFNIVDFYEGKRTSNGEFKKLYCTADTYYLVYVPYLDDGVFDVYEYDVDNTNRMLAHFTTTGIYMIKTSANHSYLRLYGSGMLSEMTVKCLITEAVPKDGLFKSIVSSFNNSITSTALFGFSDLYTMPSNRIYKIDASVASNHIANLPMYGVAATVAVLSSDVRNAVTDFKLCFYINNNLDAFIGFSDNVTIKWSRIDHKDINSILPLTYWANVTRSGSGEVGRFTPTVGVDYDIYISTEEYEVYIYEFLTDNTYNTIAIASRSPFYIKYTPDADVDYVRFYCAVGSLPSCEIRVSVLESKKDSIVAPLPSFLNTQTFTNELAAVRKATFIGDSLMSGYYSEGPNLTQHGRNLAYSWPAILGREIGMIVQHASQSGVTTKTWWTDGHIRCKDLVTASTKSQLYVVGIGTNDYKTIPDADITPTEIGDENSIDPLDYNNNLDDFWGNYAKILQYVHSVAPDAQIICMTIPSPRPETAWKEQAIREICALTMFEDYVSLCDLVDTYRDIVDSLPIAAHRWEGHFTPIGYATSAAALKYCLSDTMRRNKSKFITLPQIAYDEDVIVIDN